MCQEPAITAEVYSAAYDAYHAHAAARFRGCGCVLEPNAINLQVQDLASEFLSGSELILLENHKGLRFAPCYQVTNRYTSTAAVLSGAPEARTTKNGPIK